MGKINREIEEKMKKTTIDFFKDLQTVEKSMKLDIAIRNEKTNQFLMIAQKLTPLECIYFLLNKENAVWKNLNRYENYYWRPNPDENKVIDLFLIDDPKVEDTSKVFYEIQTSENKKQYIVIMTEKVIESIAKKYQKALIKMYQGDKGASYLYQYRRVPGFFNLKYNPIFFVSYVKHANFISKHEIQIEKEKSLPDFNHKPTFEHGRKKKKCWIDFADTEDESRTDFRYAMYLLNFYPPQEVEKMLMEESPDLLKRKGRHAESYIKRTVQKAFMLFKP